MPHLRASGVCAHRMQKPEEGAVSASIYRAHHEELTRPPKTAATRGSTAGKLFAIVEREAMSCCVEQADAAVAASWISLYRCALRRSVLSATTVICRSPKHASILRQTWSWSHFAELKHPQQTVSRTSFAVHYQNSLKIGQKPHSAVISRSVTKADVSDRGHVPWWRPYVS